EMAGAFRELEKAIHSRKRTAEEARKEYEAGLKEIKAAEKAAMDAIDNSDEAFALYGLADMVTSTDEYIDAYPEPFEDPVFEPEPRPYGVDNWIIDEATKKAGEKGARLINRLIEAHNWEVEYNKTDFGWEYSRFASDYSTAIGKTTEDTKEKDEPSEVMEEAAFASYIYNRLLERGGRNTFLTRPEGGKTFNVRRAVAERINPEAKQGEAGDPYAYPYPVGRERQAIFNAFDKVFSTLKWETTEQGTRLYQKGKIVDLSADFNKYITEDISILEKLANQYLMSLMKKTKKHPIKTGTSPLKIKVVVGENKKHIIKPNIPLSGKRAKLHKIIILNLENIIPNTIKINDENESKNKPHNTSERTKEHKRKVELYVHFTGKFKIIIRNDEGNSIEENYAIRISAEQKKGQDARILNLYNIEINRADAALRHLSQRSTHHVSPKNSISNNTDSGQTLYQSAKNSYNENEGKGNGTESYEPTDDFRRVQEESRNLSKEDVSKYHRSGNDPRYDDAKRSLGAVYEGLLSRNSSGSLGSWSVESKKNNTVFNIQTVIPSLFHDIFEINRNYLQN
ncbi:MAG: hypothetical protein K5838_08615, partial [Elusimicrobiales bacterium]|nr:hypothetical protein [Elusimicrobiales bacterium]